jgi:DNA-binding NtrC family response regulator
LLLEEDGLSFLKWLRQEGYELPVLMVSALDTAKSAVQALRLGAADYLVKGFELDELRQRVANLLKLATLQQENMSLRRRLATEGNFGQMIGRSTGMRRAFEIADRVAPTDSTVLILGESGTGKDLVDAIERDYLPAEQHRDYETTFGHYGMDGRPTKEETSA